MSRRSLAATAGRLLAEADDWLLARPWGRRLRRRVWLGAAIPALLAGALVVARVGPASAAGLLLSALALGLVARRIAASSEFRRRLAAVRSAAGDSDDGFSWSDWEVDPETRARVEAARREGEPVILGRIDGDGRLASPFGAFPGFEPVAEEAFLRRRRSSISLVLRRGRVLVRKDYHGNRRELIREAYVLSRLAGRANVPRVFALDLEGSLLDRDLVPGDTVNDLLVRAGARIRLAQTADDPELGGADGETRLQAILDRGAALVPSVLSEGFRAEIGRQVGRIHAAGITDVGLTFGNVIVDPRRDAPWFFDFGGARAFRSAAGLHFAFHCHRDRIKLRRLYGRAAAPGAALDLDRGLKRRALAAALALGVAAAAAVGALFGAPAGAAAAAGGAVLLALGRAVMPRWRRHQLRREARRRTRSATATGAPGAVTRWSRLVLADATRAAVAEYRSEASGRRVVVGRFDEDGRLHGVFGDLPGIGYEAVSANRFRPRKRTTIELVLEDDLLFVVKDFRGDQRSFVYEWHCLAKLQGLANVPALHRVDEARTRLTKSLVPGRKLRDLMIDAGARILDEDSRDDPELAGLDPEARAEVVCRRGRRILRECLPPGALDEIVRQVEVVHRHGITRFGFTPGNVILDADQRPWFFDFDGAVVHRSPHGPLYAFRRDQDRAKLERHYDLASDHPSRRAADGAESFW